MNLIDEAYNLLFGEDIRYETELLYTGRLKHYNSNAMLSGRLLTIKMAKDFRHVSREIQIGAIQSLLLRIFKKKQESLYIDLYNSFVKSLHLAVPKTESDPMLEESFKKVNERYFDGLIEQPNLRWTDSRAKFGSYNYKKDSIEISTMLEGESQLIDYVMYHEILHKKHKFYVKGGRSYHHTSAFRKSEREFENASEVEKRLQSFGRWGRFRRVEKRRAEKQPGKKEKTFIQRLLFG